jgi:A/G-specific adenine glycosylase
MLQQTQVARVLIKYPEFLRKFPTLRLLAQAKQRDVVIAWQGMGYNNRAVRLHQFAETVVRFHGGRLPRTEEALLALPGIGRYTANALLSAAFAVDTPVVDVNVRRFLSRLLWKMRSVLETKGESEIWSAAEDLLPKGRAYDWNQALMDMGATICTARAPGCEVCPVAVFCLSRRTMNGPISSNPRKKESSLSGVPNRMYRGRIIEVLRKVNGSGTRGKGIRADVLGRTIYARFSDRNAVWLQRLLEGLVKDGLILTKGNGTLKTRKVTLA